MMKMTDLSILCKWENLKSSWMVSVSVSAVVINDPSLLTVMLPLSHRCTRPQVNTHKVCNCRLCATLRKYVFLCM